MRNGPLAAAATLALAGGAAAYQVAYVSGRPRRWLEARATVFVEPTMLPARAQAMRNACDTWSAVPGSEFRFVFGGSSPSGNVQDHGNGRSDLYFDPGLPPFGYAVTYAMETGEGIVERDVAFHGAIAWDTTGTMGGVPDVETVALHELGHVLGLLHEDAAPSVMHSSGDPSVIRRTLYTDDEDGVRFLYPPGGFGSGGGGGGPAGPDVAAQTLTVASGSPGAGKAVGLKAVLRNRSGIPAGPFRVKATLSPALPVTAGDEEIGTAEVASLAGGAMAEVLLDAFVPATTPPGQWRLGAYVDPEDVLGDPDRRNNHAAVASFTVAREDAEASLGDVVSAGLGPLGKDGTEVWIGAGTTATFAVRGQLGVRPFVRLLAPGTSAEVASAGPGRSARMRVEVPEDGVYRVEVVNSLATVGRYRLLTSGAVRRRGLEATAPGEVPFAGYEGGIVSLRAAYGGEAAALLCRPPTGPDVTGPARLRGRRAALGPFPAPETGTHAAVLGGEGPLLLRILSRTPRPGGLVVR